VSVAEKSIPPNAGARSAPQEQPTLALRALFSLLVVGIAALQVWAHRNELGPDGISYIELARSSLALGLPALTNAYWSPLYPFLISELFRVIHPPMGWEFAAVHLLNLLIYLGSFACFGVFLREFERARSELTAERQGFSPLSPRRTWILGNLLFLWAAQFWLSPAIVNPDLSVAALVYLATAMLFRIRRSGGGALTWISLGGILGVAYLAKAAMFPLGFVFLFSAFFLARRIRLSTSRALVGTVAALAIFLAIAAPWIHALSNAKGRWTFGDSGKIAYAEYVNGATLSFHWQGKPPGTGTPLHPTREILSDPPLYEFAQPVPGSYPPWYDPSYWYDGIHAHFAIRGQLWVLFRALNVYFKMFSKSGALYAVFLALFWALRRAGRWQRVSAAMWLVMLPSILALAMYSLVLVELRYVSPFALMLLVWTLSRAEFSGPSDTRLARRAILVATLAPAVAMAWPVLRDARDAIEGKPYEDWQVASALPEFGIRTGAALGYIGSGGDAYWAHLAGDRIIAEIPGKDQSRFVSARPEEKLAILRRFAELGVPAVVTKNAGVVSSMPEGWERIGHTQYFIWRFAKGT
jgi:hypothetical protein